MHGRKLKSIHSTKSQGCSDPLDKMVPYWHITYKCPPVYLKSSSDHLASLVAQRLKCLPAMQETRLRSLSQEDPLEKEMATHSSILAWRIPWREEPGGLQSMGSQRVGHSWANSLTHSLTQCECYLNSCQNMSNSSTAFWNFLESLFLEYFWSPVGWIYACTTCGLDNKMLTVLTAVEWFWIILNFTLFVSSIFSKNKYLLCIQLEQLFKALFSFKHHRYCRSGLGEGTTP